MEAEKEKNSEIQVTSLKVKSTIVGEDQDRIRDLKQKIDALMTVVKFSTLGGAKLKQNNGGATLQKTKDNVKNGGNAYKGQGLATTSAGLFKPGQNFFSAIVAGGGDIVISNAQARGHQLEDLIWGQGTSKSRQGSQS